MSQFITPKQVFAKYLVSPGQQRRLWAQGKFPKGILLSPRRLVYLQSEIEAWAESVAQNNRKEGGFVSLDFAVFGVLMSCLGMIIFAVFK